MIPLWTLCETKFYFNNNLFQEKSSSPFLLPSTVHNITTSKMSTTDKQIVGTISTSSTAAVSIADSYNTSYHFDGSVDITDVAGNRLYHHGIARSKKLAERCARESDIKQELHPILRKDMDEHYASYHESTSCSTISKAQSVAAMQCSRRLYNLSKPKQDEGKIRREAIALASLKKNHGPNIDFGVLPADRAGDMYLRGVTRIEERENYLEHCRAEIEREIRKCREVNLAKGAFALDPDEAFQARLYEIRYGMMLKLDSKRRDSNQVETRDGPPSDSSVGIGDEIFISSSSFSKHSFSETENIDGFTAPLTASQRRVGDQYSYSFRGLLAAKDEKISRLVDGNVEDTFTKLFGDI